MDDLPALLTVEEAARLLRIGRTKAYAMAREWRETEGRSGLPVVDFGHVLRVPRQQLEAMVGGALDAIRGPGEVSDGQQSGTSAASRPDSASVPGSAAEGRPTDTRPASTTPTQHRTRTSTTPTRRRSRVPDYPTLPFTA